MLKLQILLKNFLTLIFILSISVTKSLAGSDVPVLVWGGGDSSKSILKPVNLFQKTSQAEFKQIVSRKVGDSQFPVLVFYRDNFCNEDVTLHDKDQLKQLAKIAAFQYFPGVDSPLTVFETLPFYNQSLDEEPESVSDGQLVISRATDFDTVADTFKILKESSPNLVGVLTGKSCSHSRPERVRRAADDPPKGNGTIFFKTKRVLLYLEEPPILQVGSSEAKSLGSLIKNATESGDGTDISPLIIEMEFEMKNESQSIKTRLNLTIAVKTRGYYSMDKVNISVNDEAPVELKTRSDINWPYNFSYHCGQNTTYSNRKTSNLTLHLFNLQLQVDADVRFSDAYDCVGFTSISIWAGIFVTAILAMIMIWGLTMIMDIRTMDRFDDPKGKTITISATE